MSKQPTISVGIPAYNEASNIKRLIEALLGQQLKSGTLNEFIIVSDGSIDQTSEVVRSIRESRIKFFENAERQGKNSVLNEITKLATGDILIILDADTLPASQTFLEALIAPLINDKEVGIVGANTIAAPAQTFFEDLIAKSHEMKTSIYKRIRGTDNIYLCHGRGRAFGRALYEQIVWPEECPDDSFSYLFCRQLGFKFILAEGAKLTFRSPMTFADHLKQSRRFFDGKHKLQDYFPKRLPKESFRLEAWPVLTGVATYLLKHPVLITGYLLLTAYIRFFKFNYPTNHSKYDISLTSKSVVHDDKLPQRIIFSNYDDLKNPYYGGGGATAVHEIARRLAVNYEVLVITGKYPGCRDDKVEGVKYERIGITILGPRFGQIIYHLLLPFYVFRKRFDVWIESFTPPFSTSFLQVFTRKPVIGLVHMLCAEDMKRKYGLPVGFIETLGLMTYDRFIVLSQKDADRIKHVNRSAEIMRVGNGVNITNSDQKVGPGQYLSYLGRIENDQKGLDLFLRAYSLVLKEKRIPLYLAGTGTDKEVVGLHRLVQKMKLENMVKVVGRLDGRQKEKFFSQSIMNIIPSRYETFSIVALESLAYGIPLITFDIDGLRWLPRDCCLKVSSFDAEALAQEILRLLNNPSLRSELSEKGKKFAKNYSWERVYAQYEHFVNQALNQEYAT